MLNLRLVAVGIPQSQEQFQVALDCAVAAGKAEGEFPIKALNEEILRLRAKIAELTHVSKRDTPDVREA